MSHAEICKMQFFTLHVNILSNYVQKYFQVELSSDFSVSGLKCYESTTKKINSKLNMNWKFVKLEVSNSQPGDSTTSQGKFITRLTLTFSFFSLSFFSGDSSILGVFLLVEFSSMLPRTELSLMTSELLRSL